LKPSRNDFFHAFCSECRQRVERAAGVLEEQPGAALGADALNRLHQEFDSLSGAARAVNLLELEYFFRTLASYARHLHRKSPAGIDAAEYRALEHGIEASLECRQDPQRCLEGNLARRTAVMLEIEARMTGPAPDAHDPE